MKRQLAILFLLGTLLGSMATMPAQAQEPDEPAPDEPACYDRAADISRLSDDQARRLCGSSSQDGPVACFEAAVARTDLGTDDAVTLCQCARNDGPVSCYERGLNTSLLSSDALRMCSQTFSTLFPAVCLQ